MGGFSGISGAGTGTIPVEIGLLCPNSPIIAIERDERSGEFYRRNCDRFRVKNVTVFEGSAPDCLPRLHRSFRPVSRAANRLNRCWKKVWQYLKPNGRIVATGQQFGNPLSNFPKAFLIYMP
ncbi:MAG UNVERIFIED_CONTAM: class I SAM-dependent methyltransferase [Microcystis novacekii LVE1205-3]|jgi:cobalt-precorrin-6B (C15)-methyltransferase